MVNELKVVQRSEAEKRIFFVSAKEALLNRLNESRGTANSELTHPFYFSISLIVFFLSDTSGFPEGFSSRYLEFQDFERKFEECISKTAVVTKFDHHTQRGKAIGS